MSKRHRHSVRVYVEDTDIGGIVYYANYLKFAERARTEMLRDAGISHAKMIETDGLFLAVRHCQVDFLKPARLDDDLLIETHLNPLRGVRLRIDQEIKREQDLLVALQVEIVCIDTNGRPVRFPHSLLQALEEYQPTTMEKV